MSKRFGEHTSLGEAIKDFLASSKLEKGLNRVSAEEAWHEVMGSAISKYTTKTLLEGNTFYVDLSSSVLREELGYGKDKMIVMLNEALGKELIKKIVLR